MDYLVVGMMKNPEHARQVAKALAEDGFEREDVCEDEGFIGGLCRRGVPEPAANSRRRPRVHSQLGSYRLDATR